MKRLTACEQLALRTVQHLLGAVSYAPDLVAALWREHGDDAGAPTELWERLVELEANLLGEDTGIVRERRRDELEAWHTVGAGSVRSRQRVLLEQLAELVAAGRGELALTGDEPMDAQDAAHDRLGRAIADAAASLPIARAAARQIREDATPRVACTAMRVPPKGDVFLRLDHGGLTTVAELARCLRRVSCPRCGGHVDLDSSD